MKREETMVLLENYYHHPSQHVLGELVEAYLPYAKRIAKRFMGRGVEVEDLEQVASIGLLKAIERFEPQRGIQFMTYATPTIMGDLRNYIRDKGEIIRLPRDAKNKLYHMEKRRDQFYQDHLREPTFEELAKEMNISIEELLQLLDLRKKSEIFSLEASLSSEEEESSFQLFVGEEDKGFEEIDQKEWIQWIYSVLPPKEKKLLQLRYEQGLGQRDTAKEMGVSQMQISRMERKILEKLRTMETAKH
ncbi:MAG: sigma-70 family RNA polymerase sigma factor [Clostridiales bacterium]|nr:sigma-70 family RNA polymerase sigma factor [Clostridiales bacterium]